MLRQQLGTWGTRGQGPSEIPLDVEWLYGKGEYMGNKQSCVQGGSITSVTCPQSIRT